MFVSYVNFLFMSDITIKLTDLWVPILVNIAYYTWSLYLKFGMGIVIYPYLNWEWGDWYSMTYEALVPLILIVTEVALSVFSQIWKGRYDSILG